MENGIFTLLQAIIKLYVMNLIITACSYLKIKHIDPMNTDWIEKGQIKTKKETFQFRTEQLSLLKGKLYYVWAQQDP